MITVITAGGEPDPRPDEVRPDKGDTINPVAPDEFEVQPEPQPGGEPPEFPPGPDNPQETPPPL